MLLCSIHYVLHNVEESLGGRVGSWVIPGLITVSLRCDRYWDLHPLPIMWFSCVTCHHWTTNSLHLFKECLWWLEARGNIKGVTFFVDLNTTVIERRNCLIRWKVVGLLCADTSSAPSTHTQKFAHEGPSVNACYHIQHPFVLLSTKVKRQKSDQKCQTDVVHVDCCKLITQTPQIFAHLQICLRIRVRFGVNFSSHQSQQTSKQDIINQHFTGNPATGRVLPQQLSLLIYDWSISEL